MRVALTDETRKGGDWTHTLAGLESIGQPVRYGLVTGLDVPPAVNG